VEYTKWDIGVRNKMTWGVCSKQRGALCKPKQIQNTKWERCKDWKRGWLEQKRLSPSSFKKPLKPKFSACIFLLPAIIFNAAQQPLSLNVGDDGDHHRRSCRCSCHHFDFVFSFSRVLLHSRFHHERETLLPALRSQPRILPNPLVTNDSITSN